MKFLDKKEQVLDIQLTPYGEFLLSQGRFKPEYYSFSDDNVLYDLQYAGTAEVQNSTEPRIQENTVQLETQTVFSDRDIFSRKGIPSFGKILQNTENISDQYFERSNYGLQNILGTSDLMTVMSPGWVVNMISSEISSSATVAGGTNKATQNIPQLNVSLKYSISVKPKQDLVSDTELAILYPNGQFLDVNPQTLISEVQELNSEFVRENFDIEVYRVEDVNLPGMSSTVEQLIPLKFKKKISYVQNNILLDEEDITQISSPITPDNVEYYFNIFKDSEINEQLICASLEELKSKGLYVDTEIDCGEVKNISLVDIYGVDAASAAEPCGDLQNPCKDKPRTIF